MDIEIEILSITDEPEVIPLPTNLPEIFHQQVAQLESKIKVPSAANNSAKQILRSFVNQIVVHPGPNRGQTDIEVFGSLADILVAANNLENRTAKNLSVGKSGARGRRSPFILYQ
ncbi:MAG: hypothetical protein HOE97_01725 [Rhodospirillaceae bacterium]|nr:hypothetical protein [Rhodospirillaceae bacterium]